MNQAYQHKPSTTQDENINLKRSLLCCLRKRDRSEVSNGSDKRPNEIDRVEGEALDKMGLEKPRKVESAGDIKVWAIDSADEIKTELK